MTRIEDLELISLVVKGDQAAFQTLYDNTSINVYNTALAYVQDIQDAEEITQEVFINIYKHAAHFKGQSKLSTWIYRITINASINYLKKNKRKKLFSLQNIESQIIEFDHPGVLIENKEDARFLFAAIDTLPVNQKTAFILSYVEEKPQLEVANIMELSLKAVESLLQRAKKNLRNELEKLYPNRRKQK